jgi:hypothetical protein
MSLGNRYEIITYSVSIGGQNVEKQAIVYYDKVGKEITREKYDDNKKVSEEFKDKTIVDKLSFSLTASEAQNGCEAVTDRFIKRAGGNYTNITPFVAWTDCVLIGISLSSREKQDWEAVIYIDDKEAISLNSEGNRVKSSQYDYKISKDQTISIFVKGESRSSVIFNRYTSRQD